MAKTATINIQIEPEIKADVEKLFSSFGITISDAVNIFLRKLLMEGGLPFDVKQPRYNAETEAAMQEARNIAAGMVPAKLMKKRGKNLKLLQEVIDILFEGKLLDAKYKDHALVGNYIGFRECHIQPD